MAWGPPKIHNRPLSKHAARQVRKGGVSKLEHPPLNNTRPHALKMGGCFGVGGAPPKHLVPMLMGTRASSPQP
ncbi:unnamed protein product [Staurois parvus]|uniref:Uncharacterized protein n=1 Tax=Staurois parvus TaxID=386267 RepID=A0ABN9E0G9_9NEOB|nr:unnamed protein product [Staurois parvus]